MLFKISSIKKLLCSNITYAFFNVSLIYSVLVPYFSYTNIDPLQLSTLQTVESFSWFVFMYISGIIFDRFGAKISFIFGRILDLIAIILLLKPSFYNFLLAMLCFGVSKGAIYGKYESYIYNSLSLLGKLNIYPRMASVYYFIWDIALSAVAFASSILLKNNTYEILIYISIILKILGIISIVLFIPNATTSGLNQFQIQSVKEIFLTVFQCMKNSSIFTYLLVFYGVLNFFTFPLCVTIGNRILMDHGMSDIKIAQYTTFITSAMAFGTIIPIILFPNGIKVKYCLYLTLFQIIAMLCAAIIYNTWLFVIVCGFICITFSIIEVSISKHFEKYSNKKIRGSAISLSISIGTLLRMFNIMLIGYIAKYYSYHIGLIVIVIPVVGAVGLTTYKLRVIKD